MKYESVGDTVDLAIVESFSGCKHVSPLTCFVLKGYDTAILPIVLKRCRILC